MFGMLAFQDALYELPSERHHGLFEPQPRIPFQFLFAELERDGTEYILRLGRRSDSYQYQSLFLVSSSYKTYIS